VWVGGRAGVFGEEKEGGRWLSGGEVGVAAMGIDERTIQLIQKKSKKSSRRRGSERTNYE